MIAYPFFIFFSIIIIIFKNYDVLHRCNCERINYHILLWYSFFFATILCFILECAFINGD